MPDNKAETLELLLETGLLLSSKLELKELLTTILEFSARVVAAETASLLLLDEQTQELYFDVALGLGAKASRLRLPLGQGIAGCVAASRRSEIINDVRTDSRWSPAIDEYSGFVTRSILAVPMLLKDRLIGVVEAINKCDQGFTPQDMLTLQAFASQASVAIENARLFATLHDERHKLNTIFTEMTDGTLLTDSAGKIIMANEAAWKSLSTGTTLRGLDEVLSGMAVKPPLPHILGGCAPCDFTAVRKEPKLRILAGRATNVALSRSTQKELPGWLFILRDVTEESQKLQLKQTFLSLISHKLMTPLTTVTGFSAVLLDKFRSHPPEEMVLKAVQTIAFQGHKLTSLVDKLLRYITLENPDTRVELVPVPLDTIVQETLAAMAAWLNLNQTKVLFQPAGVSVLGDKRFLCDLLKNLIENAVKFDPQPEKRVTVWVATEDGKALLNVQDSGPGIPPEEQENIFSRFHQIEASFTGQVEGWGLGLPFVQKVAQLHGGKVHLVSQLGAGTTVTVALPRSQT